MADQATQRRNYRPIADYALVGDCRGAAMVARDGGIDWATLHRFDAEPVFCRLLDAERGGYWSIRPCGSYTVSRAYLSGTNILRTVFTTAGGSVALTDLMPVGRRLGARRHDYVHLNAPGWIVRRLEGLHGEVAIEIDYRPSKAFASEPVELEAGDRAVRAGLQMPTLYSPFDFALDGDRARSTVMVSAGESHDLVLADNVVEGAYPGERIDEFLGSTRAFWEEWISYCRYGGPHQEIVGRSALALKLLTFAPSGAMVAAATTSLPEEIGGQRNWDYRFCWVRDASFALYALSVLGYSGEAQCFHDFLLQACARTLPYVRPMYAVDGSLRLQESTLDHLEGYRESAPVRTGNEAYLQLQMDVYGQVLDLALMYEALGGRLDEQYRRLLDAVTRFIAAHWRDPDHGIWESRGEPRHFVHAKLMSWVGLDRAAQMLDPAWRAEADAVKAELLAHVEANGCLRQAYDGGTDAAVLLAPMLGFPLPAGALGRTISTVRDELGEGGYMARYRGADGVAGGEGAFLVCSSWLADAELADGRPEEAQVLIDRLVACANDVGLLAEEIDPSNREFLGNFPQALTHLGLIANVVNLQLCERGGVGAVQGSYADRARRAVTATFGWRGVLAAMLRSRSVGRWRSSRASQLAWP
ncbi:MAG: glycoside hydrolase family 15 protein [Casimicrobiaceae bacterium]